MDDAHLFFSFRSFLITVANREVARIYADRDPLGAKIYRTLKEAIQRSKKITMIENLHGYIVMPADTPLLAGKEKYPIEALENQLIERRAFYNNAPAFMNEVVAILCEQELYRRTVALYDLVMIRKKYVARKITEEDSFIDMQNDDALSQQECNYLHTAVVNFLHLKISETYVTTGKLDTAQSEILEKTMNDIMNSWFLGDGDEHHYYLHLQNHLSVTRKLYDSVWKDKVEYLVKLAKNYIAEHFEKNL